MDEATFCTKAEEDERVIERKSLLAKRLEPFEDLSVAIVEAVTGLKIALPVKFGSHIASVVDGIIYLDRDSLLCPQKAIGLLAHEQRHILDESASSATGEKQAIDWETEVVELIWSGSPPVEEDVRKRLSFFKQKLETLTDGRMGESGLLKAVVYLAVPYWYSELIIEDQTFEQVFNKVTSND